jgi:hypothetical protein
MDDGLGESCVVAINFGKSTRERTTSQTFDTFASTERSSPFSFLTFIQRRHTRRLGRDVEKNGKKVADERTAESDQRCTTAHKAHRRSRVRRIVRRHRDVGFLHDRISRGDA